MWLNELINKKGYFKNPHQTVNSAKGWAKIGWLILSLLFFLVITGALTSLTGISPVAWSLNGLSPSGLLLEKSLVSTFQQLLHETVWCCCWRRSSKVAGVVEPACRSLLPSVMPLNAQISASVTAVCQGEKSPLPPCQAWLKMLCARLPETNFPCFSWQEKSWTQPCLPLFSLEEATLLWGETGFQGY